MRSEHRQFLAIYISAIYQKACKLRGGGNAAARQGTQVHK